MDVLQRWTTISMYSSNNTHRGQPAYQQTDSPVSAVAEWYPTCSLRLETRSTVPVWGAPDGNLIPAAPKAWWAAAAWGKPRPNGTAAKQTRKDIYISTRWLNLDVLCDRHVLLNRSCNYYQYWLAHALQCLNLDWNVITIKFDNRQM